MMIMIVLLFTCSYLLWNIFYVINSILLFCVHKEFEYGINT